MTKSATQKVNAKKEPLNNKKTNGMINVGMIGVGYWGVKLARNFHELDGGTLKCVADLKQDRLKEITQLYPDVATTTKYESMFKDVDAVVVATPVHSHYRLARAALEAGKHVMVEKPLTSKASQAHELVDLAKKNGLSLMVGHTFVYNPAVDAVREVVQSGQLGNIYYINATRANLGLLQPDINVMWDLAPHDISMLRYILGQDPSWVTAHGGVYINTRSKLHEVVYLSMYFGNMLVNIRLSWLDPVKQRRVTIVGSKKMLVYDDILENKVVIYDKGVDLPPYSDTLTEEEFRASYRHGEETVYPVKWVEPLRAECNAFLDSIRTGKPSLSSGEDGLKVVQILESAQRSLVNHGCELRVEY
jgi:predicted dehydrogenase